MQNIAQFVTPFVVSERALLRRINRRLTQLCSDDGVPDQVRKTRGGWPRVNLGVYYLDTPRTVVTQNHVWTNIAETHVDLEKLARELGVLATRESLRLSQPTEGSPCPT
jgi:hypothetical protein